MVFAPHPDDEVLYAGGVIRSAVLAGNRVVVVIMTNGDLSGPEIGYRRIAESVDGTGVLGVPESNVVFLGYGDGSLAEIYGSAATTVVTSAAGAQQTYANRGLGGSDFHRYRTGVAGPYTRATLSQDVEGVISLFAPSDVYVTSLWDNHSDHRATNQFVTEALVRLRRATGLAPIVHDGLVNAPCAFCDPNYRWPMPAYAPQLMLPKPPYLDMTPLRWTDAEFVIVPPEMQTTEWSQNLKTRSLAEYDSQVGGTDWLWSFVKRDEVFWPRDFSNLALTATVTASTQNVYLRQPASAAVDGFVDGYPSDFSKEWATINEGAGAWIRLTWPTAQYVTQVRLYDRLNADDHISSGTLTLSNGTTVPVGSLDNNGAPLVVSFPGASVRWVQFTVDAATGANTGLAEFEVFGNTPIAPTNHAPAIASGPVAVPSAILDTGTATLTVAATDVDGDTLSYQWTATAGAISGTGPSVTFTPSVVTQTTPVTVTVMVADGRGGTATRSTVVQVSPTFAINIAGAATVTASSESAGTTQLAVKAVDGVADGYPGDYTHEWATLQQLAGAWIRLEWPTPQHVNQVWLYDRPNANDHILAGVLEFSDGTTLDVGALPNDGTGLPIGFARKAVNWIRFRVTSATGLNIGLSEIQVLASPAARAPVITDGPTASPAAVYDTDTSTLDVTAADPDGDAITYAWTVDAGRIVGSGSRVTYYPPAVTQPMRVTAVVTVTDTTGMSTSAPVTIDVSQRPLVNVASLASVTVSSENWETGQLGVMAIDGVIDGYPGDYRREWATINQTAGAFLRLSWANPQSVEEIDLYDRPNLVDNITGATLLFSDGTSVAVGALPANGSGYRITIPRRTISWMTVRVDTAEGRNVGLAEVQVFAR